VRNVYRFQWRVLILQGIHVDVFIKQIMAHYLECFILNIENPKKNASWIENKSVVAIKVLTFLVCVVSLSLVSPRNW